jgi:hypothetical protein
VLYTTEPKPWIQVYIPKSHLRLTLTYEIQDDEEIRPPIIISRQRGSVIKKVGPGAVKKQGRRVTRNEAAAFRLAQQHTDVPIPTLYSANFFVRNGVEDGSLLMDHVKGTTLEKAWDAFDDDTKDRICNQIWEIVSKLQAIPRPPELSHLYQCSADGTPTKDVLLKDLESPPRAILDDDSIRARIYERYLYFAGTLYKDTLPDMLPPADSCVFTHGDLAPRSIVVKDGQIVAVIDWEDSRLFPDYWGFANMMKPSGDINWMHWMDNTKPKPWDISGIEKSRKVLF